MKLLLVISLFVVMLVPVAAVAGHDFNDVPNSNTFHNDISWMKANGVTKGCNPPANTMYCPKNNVTREQMAAFMHRLAINKVVDAKTAVNADNLDGMDSTAFKSVAASNSFDLVVAQAATVLGSVTGFDVPVAGGGILATSSMTAAPVSGPQLGVLWVEIDGSGACDGTLLPDFNIWRPAWA